MVENFNRLKEDNMLYEGSLTAAEKSAKDTQNKEQGMKENAKTRAILQGIEESNKLYNEAMERATEEEAADLVKNMTRAIQVFKQRSMVE